MQNPSLWVIADQTVLYVPKDDSRHTLKRGIHIPEALVAFDTGDFDAVFALREPIQSMEGGWARILEQRSDWRAPVSPWMMTAGKGVDTFKSTEDRNVEFGSGEIAQQGTETPYDWIYNGGRNPSLYRSPELFLKVPGRFVTGPGGIIGRRLLAETVKPEAEFGAVLAPGTLNRVGWTWGNDQTINAGGRNEVKIVPGESENSLLLPQAKVFQHCCGIGPCIVLSKLYPAKDSKLWVRIRRGGSVICEESMEYGDYVRDTDAVIDGWLRPAWSQVFSPEGGILLLGTGTKIPNEASVLPDDIIEIEGELLPAPLIQTVVEVL